MIRFMLVMPGLECYIVKTQFTEASQLQEWVAEISGPRRDEFMADPLGNLPAKALADLLLTEDEMRDIEGSKNGTAAIENSETWKSCHGTLMVDDNQSIFYSLRRNTNSEWKLPFALHRTSNR